MKSLARQFFIGLLFAPFILVFGLACLVGIGIIMAVLAIGQLGEEIEEIARRHFAGRGN